MTFSEWSDKKKRIDGESTLTTDRKTSSSSNSGTDSSFSEWSNSKKSKEAEESAIGWLNAGQHLLTEVQSYYKNWSNDDAQYRSFQDRASSLLSSADGWRKQYAGNDKAIKLIDSAVYSLSCLKEYAMKYRDYYTQWDSEDAYKKAVEQTKAYEKQLNFDLEAGAQEIAHLEGILKEYDTLTRFDHGEKGLQREGELRNKYGSVSDLEALISEKKAYLNEAKYSQEGQKLASVSGNEDFDTYNGYVSTRNDGPLWSKKGDVTYEYINSAEKGLNSEAIRYFNFQNPEGVHNWLQQYDHIKPEEIAIYNYYYAKDGKEAAEKYLHSIQKTLNQRQAGEISDPLKGNTLLELAFAAYAGLDQFDSGLENLFNTEDDYIPPSAIQMASAMIREDLADDSIPIWYNFKEGKWEDKIFGSSLAQVGYDTITTTANMLPSIMTSMAVGTINPTAGAAVGSVLMGSSAAGNAYQEMLNLGYGKGQARAYSTLVGASEAGLQYLLGGIGTMGGKLSGAAVNNIINGVDNALARIAIKLGGNMLSEGIEEGLQEILTPWFKQMTAHIDEDVNWNDVAYSSLLGAFTSFFTEGTAKSISGVSRQAQYYNIGKNIKGADGGVDALLNLANEVAGVSSAGMQKTLSKQADKVSKNATSTRVGKLYDTVRAANNQANASANHADIVKSLRRNGFATETANDIAEALVASYNGQKLTMAQSKLLKSMEGNKDVQDAISNIVDNTKSTMGQRNQNIRDFANDIMVGKNGRGTATRWANASSNQVYDQEYDTDEYDLDDSEFQSFEFEYLRDAARNSLEEDRVSGAVSDGDYDGWIGRFDEADAQENMGLYKAYVEGRSGAYINEADIYKLYLDQKQNNSPNIPAAQQNGEQWADAAATEPTGDRVTKVLEAPINTALESFRTTGTVSNKDAAQILDSAAAVTQLVQETGMKLPDTAAGKRAAVKAAVAQLAQQQSNASGVTKRDGGSAGNATNSNTTDTKADIAPRANRETSSGAGNASSKRMRRRGKVMSWGMKLDQMKRSFNPTQRKAYKILRTIADITGIDIVLYRSKADADGNFRGGIVNGINMDDAQGAFSWHDSKIYVDINAGLTNQSQVNDLAMYSMLRTFTHEFTHFIEKHNAAEYEAFRDLVFEDMREKGTDPEDLIDAYMMDHPEVTDDEASREVVAEAMTDILPESQFIQKLAQKEPGIFKKLLERLKAFIKEIKDHFARMGDTASPEVAAVREEIDGVMRYAEKIVEAFDRVAVGAVENYQDGVPAQKNTAEGGVQYRARKNKKTPSNQQSAKVGRPVKQGGSNSTHVKMSSAAAAGILGINNIANTTESVKDAIAVLGTFYQSVDSKTSVMGFRRPISGSNLEGSLVAAGVLKRSGNGGSAYRKDGEHELRISNHSSHASNFKGTGEHLSIVLRGERSINKFLKDANNVIEVVFYKATLDKNPIMLKSLIKDIAHFIASGEYHDTAGASVHLYSGTESFQKAAEGRMKADALQRDKIALDSHDPAQREKQDYIGINNEQHQKRTATLSNRMILEKAAQSVDGQKLTPGQRSALDTFQSHLDELRKLEDKKAEQQKIIQEARADGAKQTDYQDAINRRNVLSSQIRRETAKLLELENTSVLRRVLEQSKKVIVDEQTAERSRAVTDYRETRAALRQQKGDTAIMEKEFGRMSRAYDKLEEKSAKKAEKDAEKISGLKEELRQQKGDTAIMEKEFIRIAKAYEKLEEKSAKKADKDAESIAALKDALKEESKKHRDDQKTWDAEFRRLLREYEAAGRSIERLQAKIEAAKDKVESWKRTEMRNKIRRVVKDISKLYNRGKGTNNVKEEMKEFVYHAVSSAELLLDDLYTDDDMIRNGLGIKLNQKANDLLDRAKKILYRLDNPPTSNSVAQLDEWNRREQRLKRDLSKIKTQLREEFLQARQYRSGDILSMVMQDLCDAYKKLATSKESHIRNAFQTDVLIHLEGVREKLRATRVEDMTLNELTELHEAYTMVLESIRNANKAFCANRSIEHMAKQLISDFSESGQKLSESAIRNFARNVSNIVGWNYEKLYYALERIGSPTLTQLFVNLADAENIIMSDIADAKAYQLKSVDKHGYNKWKVNKKVGREFVDNLGHSFRLTLGEIMLLYAYTRRGNVWKQLEIGGFVIKRGGLFDSRKATAYKLTPAQCLSITNTLTQEQKHFVEDMQKYLSDVMGAKGNEVSMQLYGVKLYNDPNYCPIRIAGEYKARAEEAKARKEAGFESLSNTGFTKVKNPDATATIVLDSFMDIWADHVNEMSRYHGAVPALEDIRRVMNYSDHSNPDADSVSVRAMMENRFGKQAVSYFTDLYREVNSGAVMDKLQTMPKKLLSKSRKIAVFYKLSVLIQQPLSICRAFAMVDKKYFSGPRGVGALPIGVAKTVTNRWTKAQSRAYAEMIKYAPGVTIAKEIGGFDGFGGGIRNYLMDTEKGIWNSLKTGTAGEMLQAAGKLIDDNPIANLPNLADKIAWIEIWNACKRETKDKHRSIDANSEAFMKLVGRRFTDVIRATQVYDSIFSKSPWLKSKNVAVQYMVSFMNETNVTANMVESAIRDIIKGGGENIRKGAKKLFAVTRAIIFCNVLKSLVYAMHDDDEDETYIEKYTQAVIGNVINDITVFNYVPIARDIWSACKGYDVERPDMSLFSDLIVSIEKYHRVKNKDISEMSAEELEEWDSQCTEADWGLIGAIANCFGIPVKNIYREIDSVFSCIRISGENAGKTTWKNFEDACYQGVVDALPWRPQESKSDKIYEAIMEEDAKYLDRIQSGYLDADGELKTSYYTALRKGLRENDTRIQAAANARKDMDTEEYLSIIDEIVAEGHFSEDDVVAAIRTEYNKLKDDDSAKLLFEAMVSGNQKTAEKLKSNFVNDKGEFSESSYHHAIQKGLRENDPRILQAAEAKLNKDFTSMNNLRSQIAAEGHFTWSDISAAITAEYNQLKDE